MAIFSFILRYVGNYADSIELTEETFVRVYRHRIRFDFTSKFSTWLLAIATNLCRHQVRWRMRHPTVSLDDTAAMDDVADELLSMCAKETPSDLASRTDLAKLVRLSKGRLISFLTSTK